MNNALFLYHKRCQAICSKNGYYCFAWKIQNKNPFSLFFFFFWFSILSLFSVQDESNVNNALFLYHKRCQAICSKNGYYCFAWKLQNKNPFFLVLHPLFILCSSPLLTIVNSQASKLIAHPHLSSFDIVIFHSKNLTSILPVTQKQNKTKQNIIQRLYFHSHV